MMLCSQLGYYYGIRRSPDETKGQLALIGAAVLGLGGLLLGFTLQSSMSHLDYKQQLVAREANAIETAYLRIDLLKEKEQPALRQLFRKYLDSRLRAYEIIRTEENADTAIGETLQLQKQIWLKVNEPANLGKQLVGLLVIPAINEMIDATTARIIASRTLLPNAVLLLLCCCSLIGAVLIGDTMATDRSRNVVISGLFSVLIAATIYTLLDLDNPAVGSIRLQVAEQELRALHDSIPYQLPSGTAALEPK